MDRHRQKNLSVNRQPQVSFKTIGAAEEDVFGEWRSSPGQWSEKVTTNRVRLRRFECSSPRVFDVKTGIDILGLGRDSKLLQLLSDGRCIKGFNPNRKVVHHACRVFVVQ